MTRTVLSAGWEHADHLRGPGPPPRAKRRQPWKDFHT
jgi:hypothetical protein